MPALLLAAGLLLACPAQGSVRLRRGPDAPTQVRSYYVSLDRLLDQAEALISLLARQAPRPDAETASRAAGLLEELAGSYGALSKDPAGAAAVKGFAGRLKGMSAEPLSKEARDALFSLDGESVVRWAQRIRQAALDTSGPAGVFKANTLLTFDGPVPAELAVLDVSDAPPAKEGRAASPALRALAYSAAALRGADVGVVSSRRRLWLRLRGAELYADFSAVAADAVIRIRCEEPGPTALDQARFYFFSKALYDLGFAVSVKNGSLAAVLSGERAALDPESRIERFCSAWKALALSSRLGPGLEAYLRGSVSQDENARRLDRLAAVLAAEGDLGFYNEADPGSLVSGLDAYLSSGSAREALRAEMDASLSSLGLGGFPPGIPVGQRSIDLHHNWPIEAALARGELKESGGGLVREKSYDPIAPLAALAAKRASLPKELLGRGIGPAVDQSCILGVVGSPTPRFLAKRGQWRVGPDEWLVIGLLQDVSDGRVAAFEARRAGRAPARLGAGEALRLLEEIGVLPPDGGSPGAAVPAAGAPFTAQITYDPGKARAGGRIFVTPYVSFEDRDAAAKSRGLVTTAGGPQAAMLAALAGIPFVNLAGAEWTESSGLAVEQPVLGPLRRAGSGEAYRAVVSRRRLLLKEGDAIRIDPVRGAVELQP